MKWRFSLLVTMVSLLAVLSLAAVKEFGNDIIYPVQAAFSIQVESDVSDQVLYDSIDYFAQEENVVIFRPYLTNKGEKRTFVFGDWTGKESNFTQERSALLNSSAGGMYYIDHSVPDSLHQQLESFGVKVRSADLPWYLTPFYFLFTNLRSVAIWTLFFVFALLLFAIKLFYIKKTMIKRSLGLLGSTIRQSLVEELTIVSLTSIFLVIIFWIWNGLKISVFVKTFSLLLLTNFLIFSFLILVVNSLFAINVSMQSVIGVFNYKRSGRFVTRLWLASILLSLFVFATTLSHTLTTVAQTKEQVGILNRWDEAKDFYRLTIMETISQHIGVNGEIDANYLIEENRKWRHFIQSLSDEDILFQRPSSLAHLLGVVPELEQIDADLISQLIYTNSGLIEKNRILYPDNLYGSATTEGIGVIYLPESVQHQLKQVIDLINFEYFSGSQLLAEDFQVQLIPDGQTTFLFNDLANEGELFARQEMVNAILVSFNFANIPEGDAFEYVYPSIAQQSLFRGQILNDKLHTAEITTVSEVSRAADSLLMERERLHSQLQGVILSLIMLMIAQVFILSEYILNCLQIQSKKLIIRETLGYSSIRLLMVWFAPLGFSLLAVLFGAGLLTQRFSLLVLLYVLYLIEIILILIISRWRLQQKRVTILKGDFDL